jgi:hypothetical protein
MDEIRKPTYNEWMRELRERMARASAREQEEDEWRARFEPP